FEPKATVAPRTSSKGSSHRYHGVNRRQLPGKVATRMVTCGDHVIEGYVARTALLGTWAARMENATRGRIDQRRRHARNTPKYLARREAGQAGDQHAGVGMVRVGKNLLHRCNLDQP